MPEALLQQTAPSAEILIDALIENNLFVENQKEKSERSGRKQLFF